MSIAAPAKRASLRKPSPSLLHPLPGSGGQAKDLGRVLIIVQNLSVPFDRRVWLECRTLTEAGYRVAVVCPRGHGDPGFAVLEGVELYKYRPYAPGGSKASFVMEYLYSFIATLWLATKAARKGRFTVVQSCNPPDIFWPIGIMFRLVHRSRFLFDHHDLCPETFEVRFNGRPKLVLKGLRFLERCTMRAADHVTSTNESYRDLVIARDGVSPSAVTIVRTGPDPQRLKQVAPDARLRRGREHLVAYIGVMGPQDGVDIVLKLADIVVNKLGRHDTAFTIMGSGDCFNDLVAMRDRLGLQDVVEFTGRVPDETVAAVLSTAAVGISPDPKNSFNDLSTMNKTMEYMAFALPVIAFDLRETRVSAGDAAVYATPNEVDDMARLLIELLDDGPRRRSMGAAGRTRVERELAWAHQAARYLRVYDELVGTGSGLAAAAPAR
jgi:glycosyltransferase involved in cell wall biosynthesis